MKKLFFTIMLLNFLYGCDNEKLVVIERNMDYIKFCIDNVEYIKVGSGFSVAYGKDGRIRTCEVEK